MAAPSLPDVPVDVTAVHIVKTPGMMGGRARVRGTRIRVSDIVATCRVEGWSPEEYQRSFNRLSLADVYAAFTYYEDNKDEIEREYAEDDAIVERFKREHPERPTTLDALASPVLEKMRRLAAAGFLSWNGQRLGRATPTARPMGDKTLSDVVIENRQ